MPYLIAMSRDSLPFVVIGPYPDEETGSLALEYSDLVEMLVEEDCLDCNLVNEEEFVFPDIYERYTVVDSDPTFFGVKPELRPEPDDELKRVGMYLQSFPVPDAKETTA